MSQLTLNFQPALPERFPSLRAYIAHRSTIVDKSPKIQAADMDIAPSTLSRKLNPSEGDTQRFNLDDLEAWIKSTGDASAVVEYLAAKYLDNDQNKAARTMARIESLSVEISSLLSSLKAVAS